MRVKKARKENPNPVLSGLPYNRIATPFPNQEGRGALQDKQQPMLWCLWHTGLKKKKILYVEQNKTKKGRDAWNSANSALLTAQSNSVHKKPSTVV